MSSTNEDTDSAKGVVTTLPPDGDSKGVVTTLPPDGDSFGFFALALSSLRPWRFFAMLKRLSTAPLVASVWTPLEASLKREETRV